MQKRDKRYSLVLIILLLCIFAPLSVFGIFINKNKESNPNHDQFYEGYIWFYDNNDELLSKYQCMTEICEFAKPIIDDDEYNINYYKDGKLNSLKEIDGHYTFIIDGNDIKLYDITNGTVLVSYKAVKNYNTELVNNYYIVQNNENKWGIISINKVLNSVLPFEYDFIGLINKTDLNNKLLSDKFIVKKEDKWYIVDNNNEILSSEINYPIIDYTDNYIFTKNNNEIKIYNYEGVEYLNSYSIKNYIIKDNYLGIISNNILYIYNNINTDYIKSIMLNNSNSKVELDIINNTLIVKVDSVVIENVELS